MKNEVNRQPVTAHMFEYTTSFGLDPDLHFKWVIFHHNWVLYRIDERCRYPDKGIVPTQIIFLLKERNQKKINSHRWFFNAFGPLLVPNICVLIVRSPLTLSLLTLTFAFPFPGRWHTTRHKESVLSLEGIRSKLRRRRVRLCSILSGGGG